MMKANGGTTEFDSLQALVISPSEEIRAALSTALASTGVLPIFCGSVPEACGLLDHEDIRIVICDDGLPDKGLQQIVAELGKRQSPLPVIATSRTGEWDEFLEALRQGAFDYLSLPPRSDELARILASALGKSLRPSGMAAVGATT